MSSLPRRKRRAEGRLRTTVRTPQSQCGTRPTTIRLSEPIRSPVDESLVDDSGRKEEIAAKKPVLIPSTEPNSEEDCSAVNKPSALKASCATQPFPVPSSSSSSSSSTSSHTHSTNTIAVTTTEVVPSTSSSPENSQGEGDSQTQAICDAVSTQTRLGGSNSMPGAVSVPGPDAARLNSYDSNSLASSIAVSEHEIVAATLVVEPVAVAATQVQREEVDTTTNGQLGTPQWITTLVGSRKYCISLAVGIVLFALVSLTTVIVAVVMLQNTKRESPVTSSSQPPTKAPPNRPSPAPYQTPSPVLTKPPSPSSQGRFDDVKRIIIESSVSESNILNNKNSPQYKAAQWIASQDAAQVSFSSYEARQRLLQRYALAVLYHSTGGNSWSRRCNFLSDKHECEWKIYNLCGVTGCDENNRTTTIILQGNSLHGTLPRELGLALSNLNIMFLQQNKLVGTIPVSFAELKYATWIDLSGNDITGSVDFLCGRSSLDLRIDCGEVICRCCQTC